MSLQSKFKQHKLDILVSTTFLLLTLFIIVIFFKPLFYHSDYLKYQKKFSVLKEEISEVLAISETCMSALKSKKYTGDYFLPHIKINTHELYQGAMLFEEYFYVYKLSFELNKPKERASNGNYKAYGNLILILSFKDKPYKEMSPFIEEFYLEIDKDSKIVDCHLANF